MNRIVRLGGDGGDGSGLVTSAFRFLGASYLNARVTRTRVCITSIPLTML